MSEILAIGAVHLDIVATYDPAYRDNLDKLGQDLRLSVGGAAYNIAAALAAAKTPVALFSVVRPDSLSAVLIRQALRQNNVSPEHLCDDASAIESAFVAHVEGERLASAVSVSAIAHVVLDYERLQRAIRQARLVVLDANLSVAQIRLVIELADRYKKPLFGCCVSESKVSRIPEAVSGRTAPPFLVVSLNALECAKLGLAVTGSTTSSSFAPETIKHFCQTLGARWVTVTNGRLGHVVLSATGTVQVFGAQPMKVKRDIGAGDAFLAAICSYYARCGEIKWDDCHNTIETFVRRVLTATDESFLQVARENQPGRHSLAPFIGMAASVAAVGLCIASGDLKGGIYLYVLPMLAGIAGAFVGRILDERQRALPDSPLETAVMGGTAGLLSGVAFAVAQTGPAGQQLSELLKKNLVTFAALLLIFGFLGGLSVKRFFGKWRRAELPDVPSGVAGRD